MTGYTFNCQVVIGHRENQDSEPGAERKSNTKQCRPLEAPQKRGQGTAREEEAPQGQPSSSCSDRWAPGTELGVAGVLSGLDLGPAVKYHEPCLQMRKPGAQ